jgi:UDP-glucose 4-epimerase
VGTILVTGIAGGLSQRVAKELREGGHEVVGVDYRAVSAGAAASGGPLAGMPIYQANYNKTRIEDVFRRHSFEGVFHLGRVGNLKESMGKRFDLNVVGTQKIMNLCIEKRVTSLVVLSTFHIYGAHAANHTPIYENEPLRAGLDFPQIADAIQLDNMASTWVFQHPDVNVSVLRPTNVVGPTIRNTMSNLLRQARIPYLFGFDPMSQFVHEDDLASAILNVFEQRARGVFNVAGSGVLPFRTALEIVGAQTFPLPYTLAAAYLKAFPSIPSYLLNFLRYPCVIADTALREATGWHPRISIRETLLSTVRASQA